MISKVKSRYATAVSAGTWADPPSGEVMLTRPPDPIEFKALPLLAKYKLEGTESAWGVIPSSIFGDFVRQYGIKMVLNELADSDTHEKALNGDVAAILTMEQRLPGYCFAVPEISAFCLRAVIESAFSTNPVRTEASRHFIRGLFSRHLSKGGQQPRRPSLLHASLFFLLLREVSALRALYRSLLGRHPRARAKPLDAEARDFMADAFPFIALLPPDWVMTAVGAVQRTGRCALEPADAAGHILSEFLGYQSGNHLQRLILSVTKRERLSASAIKFGAFQGTEAAQAFSERLPADKQEAFRTFCGRRRDTQS